jgi:hypothetical protein
MGASQAVSQVSVMPKSVIKQGKDHSVVGINKAYQTGTTAVTSHPDTFSVTQHNMSHHPQQHLFASVSQTEILNYPYAYDQDLKQEVDYQEKLYRAGAEEKRYLTEQRQLSLYPHGTEEF